MSGEPWTWEAPEPVTSCSNCGSDSWDDEKASCSSCGDTIYDVSERIAAQTERAQAISDHQTQGGPE